MISQEKILEMIKNDNIITQTSKFVGKQVKNFHWLVDEENKQHFVIEFDMIENDRFLTIFIKDNTFDFTLDYTIENNKINKNILKKLQNLSYINIKEIPNLDNVDILYIDGDNVFTQKFGCGVYEIEKLDKINLLIEKLFVDIIKKINKPIEIENNDIISTINNQLSIIDKERKEIRKRKSEDVFILTPKGFYINGYETTETEYLENKIIFGYKTEIDEPGIVLITNKEGLIDKKEIKLSLYDIGFYPQKSYSLLKIK